MILKAALRLRKMTIESEPDSAAMRRSLEFFKRAVSALWRGQTGTVHKGCCGIDESGVE